MGEANANDQGTFFERPMDGETSHQFQAFTVYKDLGLTRSLKRASELFYADRQDAEEGPQGDAEGTPGSGALRRFKLWSREFSWVARSEAFDAEEARRRSLQTRQHRVEMLESHLMIAKLGLKVGAKTLYDCARGEAYFPHPSYPPSSTRSQTCTA